MHYCSSKRLKINGTLQDEDCIRIPYMFQMKTFCPWWTGGAFLLRVKILISGTVRVHVFIEKCLVMFTEYIYDLL